MTHAKNDKSGVGHLPMESNQILWVNHIYHKACSETDVMISNMVQQITKQFINIQAVYELNKLRLREYLKRFKENCRENYIFMVIWGNVKKCSNVTFATLMYTPPKVKHDHIKHYTIHLTETYHVMEMLPIHATHVTVSDISLELRMYIDWKYFQFPLFKW